MTQQKFLEKQLAKLKDPATASLVTSDLCRVRDALTSPGNLRVFMATDIDKLSTPLKPWEIFMGRANSKRYVLHNSLLHYTCTLDLLCIIIYTRKSFDPTTTILPSFYIRSTWHTVGIYSIVFLHKSNSHFHSCYFLSSCSPSLPPILPPSHCLSDTAAGKTLVAGVGGVESNFLIQSVPCVRSHDHPDYPAILVFIEYLTALEVTDTYCHSVT